MSVQKTIEPMGIEKNKHVDSNANSIDKNVLGVIIKQCKKNHGIEGCKSIEGSDKKDTENDSSINFSGEDLISEDRS